MRRQPTEVTRVAPTELEAVRERENAAPATKPNIFIGTLNIVTGPMRFLADPVKKVCYPQLEAHWEKKYHSRFPKHAGKLLLFDLVLLALASALAVSLVLVHTILPPITRINPISVSLTQPQFLTSGLQTELTIEYVSGSDTLVRDAQLIVETPNDFVLLDGDGTTTLLSGEATRKTFLLGDLPALARGQITLVGSAYGTPGETLPILARLSYWETGRAERTVTSVYYQIPISESPLNLSIEFEEPFMTDTVNLIRINYENSGEETLADIRVGLSIPSGFRLTGAVPPLGRSKDWIIGDMSPREKGTISVYGILRNGVVPSFVVNATSAAADDEHRTINELRANADAASTGFILSHNVSRLSTLRPGQSAEIVVRYANNGNQTIENVTVELEAEGKFLADNHSFPIIWTSNDVSELKSIEPGKRGELRATLQIADFRTQEELDGAINPNIRVTSSAEYNLSDKPARIFRTDSGVSDLPLSTSLTLDAASLYFTQAGDQLGVGPIPPKADEVTRLWVVITVENGPNSISNAQLTANLMPNATWTDKTSVTSGRPLAFVVNDRKLIWNIGDIPAFTGGHLPRATANFEIEVAPNKNNIGEVLELLDHIYIEGVDAYTGAKVTASSETITTKVRFGPEDAQLGEVTE